MSLLWMDGFDHYGTSTTGRTNMLLGVYADVDTSGAPSTTNPRNSICSYATTGAAGTGLRRVFGASKTTVGVGGAFWFNNLPSLADQIIIMAFLDQDNIAQCSLVLGTDGKIAVKRGSLSAISAGTSTTLGTTATTAISAGVWHHIEAEYFASQTVGTVEVRVDEVAVLTIAATDTCNTSNVESSQVLFGRYPDGNVLPAYVDDIFAWDTAGSYNNDFVGDKDILPYYPDADGATTAWVRNTGSADYDAVNETVQDGDSTYLQADNASDVEELELEAVPATVAGIVAIQLVNCMRKTQSGASNVTAAIVEDATDVAASGTDRPMTEEYAYYGDVIERNPAAGTPAWTSTTLSSARLRLTRTV